MADFIEATDLSKLPPGQGTTVTLSGREIALFNVEGTIYAMDDACPHAGASLGYGKLEGKVVTCRAHGWCFNVTTGGKINVPDFGVQAYQAKIEDGKILVAVPGQPTAG